MSSNLSDENLRFIRQAVAEGRFESQAQALDEAVRLLKQESQSDLNDRAAPGNPAPDDNDAWSKRFTSWVDSHADIDAVADDSRESIYGGRGE